MSAPDAYYFEGLDNVDSLGSPQGDFFNRMEPAYYSYSLIQFEAAEKTITAKRNEPVTIRFGVKNGYDSPVKFPAAMPPAIGYAIWDKDDYKQIVYQLKLEDVLKKDSVDITIYMPEKQGEYKLKAGISAPPNPLSFMTHNSQVIKLNVEF